MVIGTEELLEVIQLWPLEARVRQQIAELIKESPPLGGAHLFRYYGEQPSKVRQLEESFAQACGANYALAVNSGTSALIASLIACGIAPGDEVIVPGYTFFATASAVVVARAIPIIAEIDETLCLDPQDVRRKITPQTKAIMPVHMRGLPADMESLTAIAKEHGLMVIEDVAQACGGRYKGKWLGRWSDVGCFSFDFYKIVASGEGGMVITDDEMLYIRAQSYHDTAACWRPDRYARERMPGELFCGENYRMSEVHGAIALAQLRKLDGYLTKCRANKRALTEALSERNLSDFKLAPVNDAEGDAAQCLVLLAPTAAAAKALIYELKPHGARAGGIYDQTVRDWHIYSNWEHILEQKTATPEGCPFTCPYYKGILPPYAPDMCPRTLDILSRCVVLGTTGDWSPSDVERMAASVESAIAALRL